MSTSDPYIGRREVIGLGIEFVPGTSVAPQSWLRWMESSINTKATIEENESAIGVVDRVSDSDMVSKHVEGKLGGNVSSKSIGYLMLGMWGTVSTGAVSGGYYPHTFSVKQSSVPTTLTIARSTPLASQRFSYGTVESFDLDAQAGKYVKTNSTIKARIGATSSETPAFVSETLFTSRHITLKMAANIAGLSGATATNASSVKLSVSRSADAFVALGDNTAVPAVEFNTGAFEAKGELVVRMTDTQYETDFLANTAKAMSVSLVNGSDTLVFTAGQVRFRELEKSSDLNGVITATVQFFCEYSTTAAASITPVLTNTTTSYIAA